jgi:hypothetical protein
LIQLQIINESRTKFRREPVQLDILASRVANKQSKEASDNNYVGHWNMAGHKPYHRYAFAGGIDHVAENAYGEFHRGAEFSVGFGSQEYKDSLEREWEKKNALKGFRKIENTRECILFYMNKGHQEFMKEKAPADGHKQTILHPYHNFVGIGYCVGESNFIYYEEFVDRYVEFITVPKKVKPKKTFKIAIKPESGKHLIYFTVSKDDKFKEMSPSTLKRKGSYLDGSKNQPVKISPWEIENYNNNGTYEFPVILKKPGIYYVQIFQDNRSYKAPNFPDIRKKCQVSGIVIEVTD